MSEITKSGAKVVQIPETASAKQNFFSIISKLDLLESLADQQHVDQCSHIRNRDVAVKVNVGIDCGQRRAVAREQIIDNQGHITDCDQAVTISIP